MKESDIQQDELNEKVKIKLGVSKIHGVGVFALRDIEKGQRLYADEIPKVYTLSYKGLKGLFKEIREVLLEQWPQIYNGSHFAWPTVRLQAYMNHSDEPNYDGTNDVLLKDVKAGEEITEDYKTIDNYDKIYPWLK